MRRADVPCAIALRFAHSAVHGGQIRVDSILTLCLATCQLRVLEWWISVWWTWSGSECRMPVCV